MGMQQVSKFEVVRAARALLSEDEREWADRSRQLRLNVMLAVVLLASFLVAGLASVIAMRDESGGASVQMRVGETR